MPANVQQVKNIASVKLESLPCIVNNGPFFEADVPAVVIALIWPDECEIPVEQTIFYKKKILQTAMCVTDLSMVQIKMVKW